MTFNNSVNVQLIEKYLNDEFNCKTLFVDGKFGKGKTTAVDKALKNKNYREEEILRLNSYTPLMRIDYFQYLSNILFSDKLRTFSFKVIIWIFLGYIVGYINKYSIFPTTSFFIDLYTKQLHFEINWNIIFTFSYFLFVFILILSNKKYLTQLGCKIFNVSGDKAIEHYITPKIKEYKVIILDDFDRFISKEFFDECLALLQFIKEHAEGIVIVVGDSAIINKICDDETGEFFEKYYDHKEAFEDEYDVIFSLLKPLNLGWLSGLFMKYGITNLRHVKRFISDYKMLEKNIDRRLAERGYKDIFENKNVQPGPHLNAEQIFLIWLYSKDLFPNTNNLGEEELNVKFLQEVSELWKIDKINIGHHI